MSEVLDLAFESNGAKRIAEMVVNGELSDRDVTMLALARVRYWAQEMRDKAETMTQQQRQRVTGLAVDLHGELSELVRVLIEPYELPPATTPTCNSTISGDGIEGQTGLTHRSSHTETDAEYVEIGGRTVRVNQKNVVILPEYPKKVVQSRFF